MARGRQRNGDVMESEAGSEISPSGITNIPTDLLRTYPSDLLLCRPVSKRVNSPKNNDPSCLDPGEQQGSLF